MHSSPDSFTLDRYLAGTASDAEAATVRAWAESDPAREAWLTELRHAYSPAADARWDAGAAWRALQPRLDPAVPITAAPVRRWRAWALAASLVLAAGLATGGYVAARDPVADAPRVAAAQLRELRTPAGARATVRLDDGTRVVLNAGSRLRYPAGFGDGAREVWLEGEGYFEVTHDPSHPFRVHAGEAIAEDLGTRFGVRAYAELAQVDVVVAEGLVAIRAAGAPDDGGPGLLVRPGRLGRLYAGAAPVEASAGDVERRLGWTRGELVLDAPTLREALPQLERWYDVRIVVPPALGARAVNATFRDATLGQVMDALTLTLGARWTRDGRTVTLVAE